MPLSSTTSRLSWNDAAYLYAPSVMNAANVGSDSSIAAASASMAGEV